MTARVYLYINAFSTFGAMMDQVVLTSLILLYTHSAMWVSFSLAARTLGGLLSSLSSGALADRIDRRLMMITSDMLRALVVLFVMIWPTSVMILVVSFLIGFLSSFFQVGFSASIPKLFSKQSLLSSNAIIARLTSISIVSGFLLAGVMATYLGFRFVLGIDFLSYVLSAIALLNFRADGGHAFSKNLSMRPNQNRGSSDIEAPANKQERRQSSGVMQYLWMHPILGIAFVGYFIETFSASAHNLGIPLLAQMLDPRQQTLMYGLIWGVWGIGNVVATMFVPRMKFLQRYVYVVFWLAGVGMSLGFISFLSMTTVAAVLPLAFLTGIFDATCTTLFAVIQQSVDDRVRGRVIGVSTLLNRGGFGVGFLVAPFILEFVSMPHMVWLLHGLNITSMLLSLLLAWRVAKRRQLRLTVQTG